MKNEETNVPTEKTSSILLSKFLIGIRHKRIFRIRNLSGELIDKVINLYSDKFNRVSLAENNEDFTLQTDSRLVTARFNRDDIIVEALKTYDFEKRSYVEIDKEDVINLSADCLNVAKDVLSFKNDLHRIGMIFEFNLPGKFISSEDLNFGKFISDKFVNFNHEGTAETGVVRFSYKLPVSGGGVLKHFRDYRNVIIQLDESKGINENGKEEKGVLVHIDIQRVLDPPQDRIDIKDHFIFCKKYLDETLIPKFKTKGISISW